MAAYIVSTYHLPHQAARLVRLLADATSDPVLVHTDRDADTSVAATIRREVGDRPGVVHLPSRRSRYALFDHVRVTLDALEWLLARDLTPSHLVVLTGQCYPIKPVHEIERTLADAAGTTFLDTHRLPRPHWPDGGFNRVDAWVYPWRVDRLPTPLTAWMPKRQGYLALPKPSLLRHRLGGPLRVRLPRGVEALWGGIGYGAIALEHLRYIRANRARFDRFFSRAYIPDELYFQTLLMNSVHASEVTPRPIHLVDYTRHGGLSPYTYRVEDLAELAASPMLFARKFDVRTDASVLDHVDAELLGR